MKCLIGLVLTIGLSAILVADSFNGGGSGGGGTTVTAAPPYIIIGSTKLVAATLFPFTGLFSGSFLDTNTFTTTASANGDVQSNFTPGAGASAYYAVSATASIEAEFVMGPSQASGNFSGVWICDSTNNNLWLLELTSANALQSFSATLSGCNAGTPSAATNVQAYGAQTPTTLTNHFKLSVSGGTLTMAVSLDGGTAFTTVRTVSVGTISKAGVEMRSSGANTWQVTDWLSVVVK